MAKDHYGQQVYASTVTQGVKRGNRPLAKATVLHYKAIRNGQDYAI